MKRLFSVLLAVLLAAPVSGQTSLSVPLPVWPGFGMGQNAITPALSANFANDAAGEFVDMVGQVYWDNAAASKTVSSAGGSIFVRHGSVTFANGGTNYRISIQDVSGTGTPVRGDGTADVQADLVGGTDTVTANAIRETVMESGTKTIDLNDFVAIRFELTARAGADSVTIQSGGQISQVNLPALTHAPGGVPAAQAATPNVLLQADDGTVGWLNGAFFTDSITSRTFDSGTGTADEFCSGVSFPAAFAVHGLIFRGRFSGDAGNAELLLYSAPLGTPVAERTTTLDTDAVSTATQNGDIPIFFASAYTVTASTLIALCVRPTAADADAILYDWDLGTPTESLEFYRSLDATWSKLTRLDNTGAFTQDTGAIMMVGALITAIPSGGASGGGLRLAGPGGLVAR